MYSWRLIVGVIQRRIGGMQAASHRAHMRDEYSSIDRWIDSPSDILHFISLSTLVAPSYTLTYRRSEYSHKHSTILPVLLKFPR